MGHASRAASAAPPASRGAVSITTRDAPASTAASTTRASLGGCAAITTGGTPSRSRPHTVADPCGSRSITAACPPASSWAAARARARVVFPLPPFCDISASVRSMVSTLALAFRQVKRGGGA